jgi:branched-chain amino acid transport system substrate-binding protein
MRKEETVMKRRMGAFLKTSVLVGLVFSLLVISQGNPLFAAEPIKVGVVLCITGWAGGLGTPTKEAITLAAEDVNRRGGVLGRQIELYIEDDQSNPTNAVLAGTKLIRDKNVAIVIGSTLTVFCMPMLPIFEREQVPNISLGAGHEITVPLKKWVFRIPLTDYRLSPIMLNFTVNTLGARKVALLHSTDASGTMGAKGIMDTVDKYGASIVITEKFDPTDTNMVPQLTKIRAANPDAIILYTSAAPAAVVAKNYQQLGMKTPVVASHGVPTPEFVKLAGKIVEEGRWIVFGMKPLYAEQLTPDDPYRKNLYDPFKKALQEKYGKTDVTSFHANGHDSMRIVVEALKIAGRDDRAALRDALEKVRYKGLLNAEWTYSPTDHDGQSGDGVEPLIIRKDGTWWPYKK